MTEASFVDTNILVYARDGRYPQKRHLAAELLKRLWQERSGRTSIQVLNEYYTTVTRKLSPGIDPDDAWDDVLILMAWNPQPVDQEIVIAAREIERRNHTSWWDATIVAAAQAQRCDVLLSEDLQDGMVFGQLKVLNPFVPRIQGPPADYRTTLLPRARHRARGRPSRVA
jgi:predicted nucleic acid-binding protein